MNSPDRPSLTASHDDKSSHGPTIAFNSANSSDQTFASSQRKDLFAHDIGLPYQKITVSTPPALQTNITSSIPSATTVNNQTNTPVTVNRNRSASVSTGVKASPQQPVSSSGLLSGESSPASSSAAAKIKGRLRAGTWKGNSKRDSVSFVRSEMPNFDPSSDTTPRASAYQSFPDANHFGMASQPHLPTPSSPELGGGFSKRKIFGRSNSIRNLAKQSSGDQSKDSGGLLRRIGSRSFFGNMEALKSSDTLASYSAEGSKQSDPSKLASLSAWSRRKGKTAQRSDSDSIYSASEFGVSTPPPGDSADSSASGAARSSIDSNRSIRSNNSISRLARIPSTETTTDQNGVGLAENGAALPKRLSGWLLNMMGNEGSPVSSDGTSLSPVQEKENLYGPTQRVSEPSRQSLQESSKDSPSTRSTQSAQTSGSLTGAARAKAGSLLYSFAGPNKATKPTGPAAGGGGSWTVGALKYFMDSDADDRAGEGIWLLGVWHGPTTQQRTESQEPEAQSAAPSIEIQTTTPDRRGGKASSSEQGRRGSLTNAASPEESVQTPSSTHSVLPPSSPTADWEEAIVVRNPPTPHTSPEKPRKPPSSLSRVSSAANTLGRSSKAPSERSSSPTTSSHIHASISRSSTLDWQVTFQPDFSSRIWCTYRNHFAPIAKDGTISDQAASAAALAAEMEAASLSSSPSGDKSSAAQAAAQRNWLGRKTTESNVGQDGMTPVSLASAIGVSTSPTTAGPSSLGDKMGISNFWGRATAVAQAAGLSRAGGLTTDAGWGCMLRTGQSLLANALLDVHLGREWCREGAPVPQSIAMEHQEDLEDWRQSRKRYAKYVKILSWFLDDPSPACPFGVHRMAREGKRLGKEVGEWFGPSTAAGAIKQLVSECPEAGIGVTVAHDGVIYLDEVRAAAVNRSSRRRMSQVWQRPVLILIGIRLGLEGVNPMYYDSVKATFSFPHSVGIAGGRPSSSYYFMGYQGTSLFYLDPHHVRPAVPLRHPPHRFPPASETSTLVEDEEEWWSHAYSEPQIATFHCDRVRRMPIKSLDPSMLLGFLIKDEASLQDFLNRVKAMPKAIFSVAETAPIWEDDDFDPAMESVSESSVGDAAESDEWEEERKGIAFPLMERHNLLHAQPLRPSQEMRHVSTSSAITTRPDESFDTEAWEQVTDTNLSDLVTIPPDTPLSEHPPRPPDHHSSDDDF